MYKWKRVCVNMGTLTVPLKTYQLLWNIWRICSKSELKISGRGREWWGCRNYPCYKKWQKHQKSKKKKRQTDGGSCHLWIQGTFIVIWLMNFSHLLLSKRGWKSFASRQYLSPLHLTPSTWLTSERKATHLSVSSLKLAVPMHSLPATITSVGTRH